MELKKVKLIDILAPKIAMRSEIEQEGINELASSIMEVGLINPMTLRKKGHLYEIVAGFRRYQALKQLQFHEIDANIIEANENIVLQMRMDENVVRRAVSEIDEAIYIEAAMKEIGLNQTEIASKLGKSASYINERLQILTYPPELLKALKSGQITFSVAREFNRCSNIKAIRMFLKYAADGMNARTARKMVQQWEYEGQTRTDSVGELESNPEVMAATVERALLGTCDVCGVAIDSRKLRTVFVCQDCQLIESP